MNYKKIYDQLIEKAKSQNREKLSKEDPNYQYFETHHIIPRSLGGTNDEDNLVELLPREHFIVHKLLLMHFLVTKGKDSKEYQSMLFALHMMSTKKNVKITSREYERIRKEFSQMMSERMSGSGNPMYGHSCTENMTPEEYDQWLSKHQKENHQFYGKKRPEHSAKMTGENNPMFGKSLKDVMEPEKFELWRKHVSEIDRSNEKNPFFGKKHTPETRKRISEKNKEYVRVHGHGTSYGIKRSDEARKHNSESHKHPYSPERKLKQTKTVITKCCGKLCDLSEFDFETYIKLSNYEKAKYRKKYIKAHPLQTKTI